MILLSKIPVYLKACRPWSFPMSVFPMLLGALCAEHKLIQKWQGVFGFAAAAVLVIHAAANLCNTYWDYTNKVDTKEHNADPTIVEEVLTDVEVLNVFWSLFALSMMLFGSAVAISGKAHIFPYVVFFKGIFLAYNYSGGMQLKSNAMGEVVVYFTFGPAIASFIYTVMSDGNLSIKLMCLSSPLGLLAASVILANNIRDSGHDLKAGVRTIPNQIGLPAALRLYTMLVLMGYVQIAGLAILHDKYELLTIVCMLPVSLYYAYYPHKDAVDKISGIMGRSMNHYMMFSTSYLTLCWILFG